MRVRWVGSQAIPNASFSIPSANSSCRLTILTDLAVGFLPPYWPNCMPPSVGVGGQIPHPTQNGLLQRRCRGRRRRTLRKPGRIALSLWTDNLKPHVHGRGYDCLSWTVSR